MKTKKIVLAIICLMTISFIRAQDTMYVHLKTGIITSFALNKIDSIVFYKPESNMVYDIEGNGYKVIKIGTQTWMADNLKVTKYRNGDAIATSSTVTKDITEEIAPKYQWAYDGNESNVALYGRLYTWFTVTDIRGVCPAGWHIPDDAEWTTLSTYLGGEDVAGGKLKETGNSHWVIPNTGADNSSQFNALPAGYREYYGDFNDIYHYARWWSSNEILTDFAYYRSVNYDASKIDNNYANKKEGSSVRCIKN